MAEKLSEEQLNELRPDLSESLVVHTHYNYGNVGWILANGRYLANQEVEALEAERDAIERRAEAAESDMVILESRLAETDLQGKVKAFHQKFGFTVNDKPTQLSNELWRIRYNHTLDELSELQLAEQGLEIGLNGLAEVADALGDILYLVFGTAVAHGIDMTPIFNEIHRSNMTKTKPEGDAKALKGEGYSPPDIEKALRGES